MYYVGEWCLFEEEQRGFNPCAAIYGDKPCAKIIEVDHYFHFPFTWVEITLTLVIRKIEDFGFRCHA